MPRLARSNKSLTLIAVISSKNVIKGSSKRSPTTRQTNDEIELLIRSPQLSNDFTQEMDCLWGSAEYDLRLDILFDVKKAIVLRRGFKIRNNL